MFDKIMVTIDKAKITNKLLDATIEIARNNKLKLPWLMSAKNMCRMA